MVKTMSRVLQIEAPVNAELKAYYKATTTETEGSSDGYALTETEDRLYQQTIPSTLQGIYWVLIKVVVNEVETVIDSGYLSLSTQSKTYTLSYTAPKALSTVSKKLQIEAPEELDLTAFFKPTSIETEGDIAGYSLTEISARLYEMILPSTLIGSYWVVVKDDEETIDAGYINITSSVMVYSLSTTLPSESLEQEESTTTYPAYGPKKVKTKEMEIEQFDPLTNQMAEERKTLNQPTWCSGGSCRGIN